MKNEMDASDFSYMLESCGECTDEKRAYRLNVKEFNKNCYDNSLFKNGGLKIYVELRYEYYRMEIPCPLCECLISRFKMAPHQLSKKCKAIQEIEKNKTTKSITYKRADGTCEIKNYDFQKNFIKEHYFYLINFKNHF